MLYPKLNDSTLHIKGGLSKVADVCTRSVTLLHELPLPRFGGCDGSYLPVVKHGQSESLSLCVRAQVRLKAEGVDGGDESFDGVEGRPWDRSVLGHVTSGG